MLIKLPIYQRYIARNIISPLLLISFIITGLVWLTQILKMLYLMDKGIGVSHFFSLVVLIIPSLLFVILPFTTILAVIFTYNKLSEERQLIILKNSGLNNIELAKPALQIALITTLLSYFISTELLPLSYSKLKSELRDFRENYASSIIQEKFFNQISKNVIIYVDEKKRNGSLGGVIIFDNRNNQQPAILFAKTGRFLLTESTPALELQDGHRQAYDENGNFIELSFASLRLQLTSNLTRSKEDDSYNKDLNEYYIHELFDPDSRLSPQRQLKLLAEGHQRLIWPLYCFILTFIGLAVFLRQPYNRKSHVKEMIMTTLSVIVVTYSHFALNNLAVKNWHYNAANYLNFIIATFFSIWLYSRRRL